MEMYKTLPLRMDSKDIRVLELQASEVDNASINGTLKVVSLTTRPSHFALSYTWGEAKFDHSIICNGFSFPVTQNLCLAPTRLRKTGMRVFWIDQICINQSSLEERDHQVQFTFSIYQAAESVCVGFGMHQENAELGVELAHRLWKNMGTALDVEQISELLGSDETLQKNTIGAFYQIYESPWFQRCWVVQEVVARPNRVAYLGRYEFDWKMLPLAMFDTHESLFTAAHGYKGQRQPISSRWQQLLSVYRV